MIFALGIALAAGAARAEDFSKTGTDPVKVFLSEMLEPEKPAKEKK
jgi:hypothetical protein